MKGFLHCVRELCGKMFRALSKKKRQDQEKQQEHLHPEQMLEQMPLRQRQQARLTSGTAAVERMLLALPRPKKGRLSSLM
jgi:hypothetical protein